MNLPANQIGDLRLAGLLHDIGKVGTRDEVLLKPGNSAATSGNWVARCQLNQSSKAVLTSGFCAALKSTWLSIHHQARVVPWL